MVDKINEIGQGCSSTVPTMDPHCPKVDYLVCPKVGFQAGTTLETALGQANKLYPV